PPFRKSWDSGSTVLCSAISPPRPARTRWRDLKSTTPRFGYPSLVASEWRDNTAQRLTKKNKSERRGSVAIILSMPKWGLAMKTGLVVEWLKHPGDAVQQGEPIVEIESEKASNEVEAPAAGTLRFLVVPEGEHAAVGEAI